MAGELRNVTDRRALAGEVAALPAQRIPRYERARPARPQAGPGDDEGGPGPAPRPPRAPVSESTPDRRGPYSQPVTDGRGDAEHHALDDAATRQQRRRERKAPGDERPPAAGQRDVEQPGG